MANNNEVRGTIPVQEVSTNTIHRDIRPSSVKVRAALHSNLNMINFLMALAVVAFIFPQFGDLLAIVSIMLVAYSLRLKQTVPLKLPSQSGLIDTSELKPGTNQPQLAKGIFFLGNEVSTGKEVWLTDADCRQHFLVLGTTGSGKTESLLGFAANALMWGTGFIFCDGKGDASLFAKIYALTRRFGREDDLYVLNFMTGNKDIYQKRDVNLSNSINPFCSGSSDFLTQLIVGLMDDTSGEGAMWKGRAAVMLSSVMRSLVWLRDHNLIKLDVKAVRSFLNIRQIIDLAYNDKYKALPNEMREYVRYYLTSLPGFVKEKKYDQSDTTLNQHGFLEMQFTKILGSLADVYGHIFTEDKGEIDMHDIVSNRRILIVMLPALEKSREEVLNVGKIVVGTIKGMMGNSLGSEISGNWDDVVGNRLSNRSEPYFCIFDEIGYYMVGGMDLIAAQSRSLGFSMVFSGQDVNAMKAYNDKVFGSVQGNTNTKIIMRTEDPDTAQIAKEGASMAYRVHMSSFRNRRGILSKFYDDDESAKLEHVYRIDYLDLKTQNEGEMHVIYKDKVVRAKAFHAAPETTIDISQMSMRPNIFLNMQESLQNLSDQTEIATVTEKLMDKKQIKERTALAKKQVDKNNILSVVASVFDRESEFKFGSLSEISCIAFATVMKINQVDPKRLKKRATKGEQEDGRLEHGNWDGNVDSINDWDGITSDGNAKQDPLDKTECGRKSTTEESSGGDSESLKGLDNRARTLGASQLDSNIGGYNSVG